MIIRTEYYPTRCEICHQSDLFDPQTNECVRCVLYKSTPAKTIDKPTGNQIADLLLGIALVLSAMLLIMLLVDPPSPILVFG